MLTRTPTPITDNETDLARKLLEVAERYSSLVERIGYGVYRSTLAGRFVEVEQAEHTLIVATRQRELLAKNARRPRHRFAGLPRLRVGLPVGRLQIVAREKSQPIRRTADRLASKETRARP